jgi:predicted cupin superfamily sugar epimerase
VAARFLSAMNAEAAAVIARLGLEPLPTEGGFFRRTWTGPATAADGRPTGTVIYFLMTPDSDGFSALHRLTTDEVWFWHAGDAVDHVQLGSAARITRLGGDFIAGEVPQLVVAAGAWQGARLASGGSRGWALFSCTMAPGWADGEVEFGARAALQREFPDAAAWIETLTR